MPPMLGGRRGNRVPHSSLQSECITQHARYNALTLRKLDQEPLLDAGILLCGSLLELMAVAILRSGHQRRADTNNGKNRKN